MRRGLSMRGELCVGVATALSFASLFILIFAHVGQINTSTVPRKIYMARVNMSGYGGFVENEIFNPVYGLYTNNSKAPLKTQDGVRQLYEFGLYSYCAYVDAKLGICGNHSLGLQFTPYDIITADMSSNYSILSASLIPPQNVFRDSKYLAAISKGAYWMVLLGTICAALALITGIAIQGVMFFVSCILSCIGSFFLLVGASLWTIMINRTQSINTLVNNERIGIIVSHGSGLFIIWAAFVCLAASLIPYIISCCTYRG